MSHARALHKCKQGHRWIEHNNISKSSLLNILKRSMDLTVATWIHGNKITAGKDLAKLNNTNNLPGTFYSKGRARLRHAMALHNRKQGHGWIKNNYIYNSSHRLSKITKSLKSETSRSLVCMLVLVTT